MKTKLFCRLLTIGCIGGALLLIVYLGLGPATIYNHRRFVRESRSWYEDPATLRGRLSPRYVRWIVHGKPDIKRQMALGTKHEEALVQMGYFRRRTYAFDDANRADFVRTIRASALKDPLYFFKFGTNASVEVLAYVADFPEIEKVLASFGGHK